MPRQGIDIRGLQELSEKGDDNEVDAMKTKLTSLIFSLCLITTGCTQMLSHRDYLTEMEQNDERYFKPREDFPVMAGDSGDYWESEAERKNRTPASDFDLEKERNQRFLKDELNSLEAKLSDDDYEFYRKHKKFLPTVSDRIYYLKLSRYERKEYLRSRGVEFEENRVIRPHEEMFALRQSRIILGMSKADVMNNWGRPMRVEVAGNPSYENERWVYNLNGATKYIYFESGRVGGWE